MSFFFFYKSRHNENPQTINNPWSIFRVMLSISVKPSKINPRASEKKGLGLRKCVVACSGMTKTIHEIRGCHPSRSTERQIVKEISLSGWKSAQNAIRAFQYGPWQE